MNHYQTLVALILILSFSIQSVAQTHEPRRLNWDTQQTENYTISYPSNWDLDTSGVMGSHFFLFSPLTSSEDTFKENINLTTQDLGNLDLTLTLEAYVTATEAQVTTLISDGKVISSTKIDTLDQPYYHLSYTGQQGVYDLAFDQYIWLANNVATILTFTAEKDKHEVYLPQALRIMDSFKLLNVTDSFRP